MSPRCITRDLYCLVTGAHPSSRRGGYSGRRRPGRLGRLSLDPAESCRPAAGPAPAGAHSTAYRTREVDAPDGTDSNGPPDDFRALTDEPGRERSGTMKPRALNLARPRAARSLDRAGNRPDSAVGRLSRLT